MSTSLSANVNFKLKASSSDLHHTKYNSRASSSALSFHWQPSCDYVTNHCFCSTPCFTCLVALLHNLNLDIDYTHSFSNPYCYLPMFWYYACQFLFCHVLCSTQLLLKLLLLSSKFHCYRFSNDTMPCQYAFPFRDIGKLLVLGSACNMHLNP